MEKFEQFFKENRLRLDTENLDNAVWENISSTIKRQKSRNLFRQIYVAASLLLILGLSTVLYLKNSATDNQEKEASIFYKFSPDLAEQEMEYIQLINNKVAIIKKQEVPAETIALFNEFIQQLEVIDKQYELYKIEISKQGYNEDLIQQIIYNYQLKLSVLQMLHSEIDKINRLTKKDKNEKDKIKLNI
ncbi:MAG: hypothetical protein P1P88_15840 [Bacteroidales bacterium]|nr:hypothetical protein [Bacteroidales bacterium]